MDNTCEQSPQPSDNLVNVENPNGQEQEQLQEQLQPQEQPQEQQQEQQQLQEQLQEQPQPPSEKLVNVDIANENVAFNLLISFLSVAQKRGAFAFDESAKIWECIKMFQKG